MLNPIQNAAPISATPAVLLVEAEPMLRQTISKFLRRAGCRVTACPDGRAGTAMLSEGLDPALIVLGARVLDAELAHVARELHALAPTAAVLGIADVVSHEALEAAALPIGLRFLAPPFDFPDVVRAVRSCLRQAGFQLPDGEILEA